MEAKLSRRIAKVMDQIRWGGDLDRDGVEAFITRAMYAQVFEDLSLDDQNIIINAEKKSGHR